MGSGGIAALPALWGPRSSYVGNEIVRVYDQALAVRAVGQGRAGYRPDLRPDQHRNRAYYTAQTALSQLQQGELEMACATERVLPEPGAGVGRVSHLLGGFTANLNQRAPGAQTTPHLEHPRPHGLTRIGDHVTETGTIKLHRYGIDQLEQIRPTLVALYAEVYAADIERDAFFSVERFVERLAGHASRPSWEAVVAYDGGEAAGYAYASALPQKTGWWVNMLQPLPEDELRETGDRTLALFELMVRTPWRGTGLAHRIHEELLTGRAEERVTLLVDPEHPKVKALYESWGYRDIGGQQPFPDAPIYATMVRPLA